MIVECPGCKRRYDVSGRPPGTRARCRCDTTFVLPEPAVESGALKCPNCGANAGISETACSHCGTNLAVRACPRCFGKLFLGTKFCAQCGAKSEEPANALPDGNAAPRHCPRCEGGGQVRLESQLTRDVLLDTCTQCCGIFVDNDLLERILAERRYLNAAPDTSADSSNATTARPTGAQSGPFYIKCPDCSTSMARRVFAKRAGVIVDVCRHHGTWLDADELGQLIAFVQRGGLDRSATETPFESSALRRRTPSRPARTSPVRNTGHTANDFGEVVDMIKSLLG